MKSGYLLSFVLTATVCAGFCWPGSLSAQNDWADPVEQELPPRTTSRQPATASVPVVEVPTKYAPVVEPPVVQQRQSQLLQRQRSTQQNQSQYSARQHARFGHPKRKLQKPTLQFRAPKIPQNSQQRRLQNTANAPNVLQRNSKGAVQIPALTPSNLFGVRMAAQDFDIQIDTGDEVTGEEMLGEATNSVLAESGAVNPEAGEDGERVAEALNGELEMEFDDSDIYYEEADESVSVGDNFLSEELLSEGEYYGDGCADCMGDCETCSDRSCLRCRNGGLFVGGIGTYSIRPLFETNPAFRIGNGATPATSTVFNGNQFDWGTTLAPYAWLGIKGSGGFGLRARHWMFDNDTTTNYLVPAGTSVTSANSSGLFFSAGPGSQIYAEHELEFYSTDIEFSFEKQNQRWGIEGAAGVRYLDIDQYYLFRATTAGGAIQELQTSHGFDGFGPTLQLKGSHALGLLGMSVYASGRESILFGDRNSTTTRGNAVRSQNGKAVVSITELEVGLQRVVWFRRISTDFQIGLVGQVWNGVGNAANGGLHDVSRDQSMGLLGGRASLGFNF